MKNIKVSVCCLTYNQEDYIEDAIKSFVNQDVDFSYEIIIHDDASTDNTPKIIKKYEEKYPELVKGIYEKENQYCKNPNSVLDSLLKKAKGEYIALCDGDDGWTDRKKLKTQVKYMEKYPEITLCTHNTKVVDKENNYIEDIKPYNKSNVTIFDFLTIHSSMHTSSMFFRKKDIKNLPNFFKESTVGDLPLKLHLLSKGNCYHINKIMSFYRSDAKGSWSENQKNSIKILKKNLDNEIKTYQLFNETTKNKYEKYVEKRINLKEFNFYLKENNIRELKKEKYQELYKGLSIKTKIKIYLKKFVILHKVYLKIKGGINNERNNKN